MTRIPAGVTTYSGFCNDNCWRCNTAPGQGDLFLCPQCAADLRNPPPPEPPRERWREWLARLPW